MFLALAVSAAGGCDLPAQSTRGKIVVANRGSGDLTVIDARRAVVERTIALPRVDERKAEPMYVVDAGAEVMIGDRAHDRIVCLDARTFRVKGSIPVGKGVFHMWADRRQLWVNNDIDNTASVVDLRRLRVIRTVPMPADLVARGYKPHDVWVAYGFAWISLLKSGSNGHVVQYSTRSFELLRRAEVGADPHLWLDRWTGEFAVAAQNSDRVDFLSGLTLRRIRSLELPGAHGVYSPLFSRALYVTNLRGMGRGDLYNVRLGMRPFRRPRLVSTTDTRLPAAHNVATDPLGTRIYVTHSGPASRKVSVHAPRGPAWAPRGLRRIATLDAGLNPFGLAYVRPRR